MRLATIYVIGTPQRRRVERIPSLIVHNISIQLRQAPNALGSTCCCHDPDMLYIVNNKMLFLDSIIGGVEAVLEEFMRANNHRARHPLPSHASSVSQFVGMNEKWEAVRCACFLFVNCFTTSAGATHFLVPTMAPLLPTAPNLWYVSSRLVHRSDKLMYLRYGPPHIHFQRSQVRNIWGAFSLLITAATDPILGQRTQLDRLIADSSEGKESM